MAIILPDDLQPNTPALADQINSRFKTLVDELNNLGANGDIKEDAIKSGAIANGAITQDKIDITAAPTQDNHIVNKDYFDSNFNVNLTSLFGTPTLEDSTTNNIGGITGGEGTEVSPFTYNTYKATGDGILNVINDNDISKPFIVILADEDEDKVNFSKIGQIYDEDGGPGYNHEDNNPTSPFTESWPTIIRAISYLYASNPAHHQVTTVSAIIRKDEYIKIHCSLDNDADINKLDKAWWFPFSTGTLEFSGVA